MADDLAELRAEVREFGLAGGFAPACDSWMRGHDPAYSCAMAERGWIGITWPTELGGAGRSNLARLVVTEELLRLGAPVAAHWIADRQIGPSILRYGSEALQREFLPRIAAGEVTFCLGMSESEAGSDLAAVRTVAERDGDGWRITGRKLWTSHAHRSTHAYVLARTHRGERRHEGLTEFIVDMSAPGVSVRPIVDLAGEHHFNETILDGVYVPDRHVIGEVGAGWSQVTEQLAFERGGLERVLSTYPLLAALIDTVDPADVRAVAAVGELVARVATLRELAWTVGREVDAGRAPIRQAALLKLLGTAFEREVADVARWVADAPAESGADGLPGLLAQAYLASPGFSIRGGTNEVLRTLIARDDGGLDVGPAGDVADVVRDVFKRSTVDDSLLDELGWLGVGVPEADGGAGGTVADLCAIVQTLDGQASLVQRALWADRSTERRALLQAAELVGAIERAYALTVTHVRTRQQFGRPLLDFQAVAHGVAELASEREHARVALASAIATDGTPGGPARLAAARVVIGRAAGTVSRVAHQLHGAIGIAREHPLHHATTRLLFGRDAYGTQRDWAYRLGSAAVAWGAEQTWAWMTEGA